MLIVRSLVLGLFSVCFFTTLAQAKITFLPDMGDDLGFSDRGTIDKNYNQGSNCNAYSLTSCPTNATCKKCPFGKKYIITGCSLYYKPINNTCQISDCRAFGSGYITSVPTNNVCTDKKTTGTLSCYNGCRSSNCSGYNVDCATASTLANVTQTETCPDCKDSNLSNCTTKMCKITQCGNNMKVNANQTACIEKDDTCPNNYFKSCSTGTMGDPQYTERGSACWQCKPNIQTCAQYVESYFPGYNRIASAADLQHALIDGKNDLVVVSNFTLTTDIDLSGKTVMGANEIASASPLCATSPKITVQGPAQIKTNNNTEFKKLHFVNKIETKGKCYWTEMMTGGGTFRDVEFTFNGERKTSSSGSIYYTNNWNTPHFAVRGIANFYNVKSKGMKHFTVESGSTLNIKGKLEVNKETTDNSISGSVIAVAGTKPVVNIESSASLSYTGASSLFDYDGGVGDCMLSGDQKFGREAVLNINGNVVHNLPSTEYSPHTIEWWYGTVNINTPLTVHGALYTNGSTVNINAATTVSKPTAWAVLTDNGVLNINAPLTIKGYKAITNLDYPYANDAAMDVDDMYINSDLIFDTRVDFMPYISRGTVTFGPKAYVKGVGRWMLAEKSYSSRTYAYKSGAKLEIGGICRKANTTGSFKPDGKSTIIWKTPQSPFTGGC